MTKSGSSLRSRPQSKTLRVGDAGEEMNFEYLLRERLGVTSSDRGLEFRDNHFGNASDEFCLARPWFWTRDGEVHGQNHLPPVPSSR